MPRADVIPEADRRDRRQVVLAQHQAQAVAQPVLGRQLAAGAGQLRGRVTHGHVHPFDRVPEKSCHLMKGNCLARPARPGAAVQLEQALPGLLIGWRIGRHPGAEALAEPQMGVVQLQQADLRVQVPLGQVFRARDLMPLPQRGELRRRLGQPGDQALPGRLGDVCGHGRAVLSHHPAGSLFPVERGGPAALAGEHPPQRVPLLEGEAGERSHELIEGPVEGEQVVSRVANAGGERLELVEQQLGGRRQRRAIAGPVAIGDVSEPEQVVRAHADRAAGCGRRH